MNKFTTFTYGLNLVDWNSSAYPNWDGRLASAVRDAVALWALSSKMGHESYIRVSQWGGLNTGPIEPRLIAETTRKAWEDDWAKAANGKPGDTFLFAYSGHGYRDPYVIKPEEGFCFFDGLYADYQQTRLYASIPKGVNIICWYDCCHSGGLEKAGRLGAAKAYSPRTSQVLGYNPSDKASKIEANILILAASQADESAMDGPINGAFTGSMLGMLEKNKPLITWGDWFSKTKAHMAGNLVLRVQTPKIMTLGGGDSLLNKIAFAA
jgi:hypothetical protein